MKYIYDIWPSEDPSFRYCYSIHLNGATRAVNGPMSGRTTETKESLEQRLRKTVRRRNADAGISYRESMTIKPENVHKMIEGKKRKGEAFREQCFIRAQEQLEAKKNAKARISNDGDLSRLVALIERNV